MFKLRLRIVGHMGAARESKIIIMACMCLFNYCYSALFSITSSATVKNHTEADISVVSVPSS